MSTQDALRQDDKRVTLIQEAASQLGQQELGQKLIDAGVDAVQAIADLARASMASEDLAARIRAASAGGASGLTIYQIAFEDRRYHGDSVDEAHSKALEDARPYLSGAELTRLSKGFTESLLPTHVKRRVEMYYR